MDEPVALAWKLLRMPYLFSADSGQRPSRLILTRHRLPCSSSTMVSAENAAETAKTAVTATKTATAQDEPPDASVV